MVGAFGDATLELAGGPGRRCQGLHNRAFLPYLELRDTERSAAAFDRWFERALIWIESPCREDECKDC
jgi:hypothetical protein